MKTDLDSLASILQVLQQGSTESKIASARVLETIANDAKSKLIVAEKENLLEELLKLISPENESSVIRGVKWVSLGWALLGWAYKTHLPIKTHLTNCF